MKQKKKIIILHVILSKGYAGSEKYVLDLVRYQKKDHKVFLVILKSNMIFKKYLDDKIKTFEIGNFLKKYKIKNKVLKNSQYLFKNGLYLPSGLGNTYAEFNKVVDVINLYEKKYI